MTRACAETCRSAQEHELSSSLGISDEKFALLRRTQLQIFVSIHVHSKTVATAVSTEATSVEKRLRRLKPSDWMAALH